MACDVLSRVAKRHVMFCPGWQNCMDVCPGWQGGM